jgi:choline-glycine betaine transporter
MTIELQRMIGNSANMPDANEPILWLAVVTMATTAAAASARSGISRGVRRNFFGGAELR